MNSNRALVGAEVSQCVEVIPVIIELLELALEDGRSTGHLPIFISKVINIYAIGESENTLIG